MDENKHAPDIKCYRINYNSKYWANVAAKVGNQCSSPVGAVFAVNALCDAYEEIAKQRDELLDALERAEAAMEICSDWMSEIEMPDGWTTTTDEKLKISAAIASVKEKK